MHRVCHRWAQQTRGDENYYGRREALPDYCTLDYDYSIDDLEDELALFQQADTWLW